MMVRRSVYACITLIAAAFVWWFARSDRPPATQPAVVAPVPKMQPSVAPVQSRIALLATQIAPDSVSPIAKDLNSPGTSIQHDLQVLNEVFGAWQTNFPHDGNPVGENDEITAALAGDNRLHFAFVAPTNPAINGKGQLCDRWGTPFRFHALSGTQMEIRSAGPDHKFGTADDVEFAPWPKPF